MTTELETLKWESKRLSTLLSFMKIFSHELDRDGLLLLVMLEITKVMMADRSTLFILDEKTGELWSKVVQGNEIAEIRFPKNLGISGHVVTTGRRLTSLMPTKTPVSIRKWIRRRATVPGPSSACRSGMSRERSSVVFRSSIKKVGFLSGKTRNCFKPSAPRRPLPSRTHA